MLMLLLLLPLLLLVTRTSMKEVRCVLQTASGNTRFTRTCCSFILHHGCDAFKLNMLMLLLESVTVTPKAVTV